MHFLFCLCSMLFDASNAVLAILFPLGARVCMCVCLCSRIQSYSKCQFSLLYFLAAAFIAFFCSNSYRDDWTIFIDKLAIHFSVLITATDYNQVDYAMRKKCGGILRLLDSKTEFQPNPRAWTSKTDQFGQRNWMRQMLAY